MAFVSFKFYLMIVLLVAVYFAVPKKYQWTVLLVFSYFYFWANSSWLLLIHLVSVLLTYFFGIFIENNNRKGQQEIASKEGITPAEKKAVREKTKKTSRRILTLGIVLVLGILLFLKYHNFFAGNANKLLSALGIQIPTFKLLLPIGISFYTLQAVAYMTDVYRGKIKADRHLLKFMLFMSYFPQIVQGPIARYGQLAHQLYEEHRFDYERVCFGAQLMLWGIMKKLIIADRVAIPVNQIFDNYTKYKGLMVFAGAILYGIQVYTDFSGGMDIARGISQMLGIELELNFRQPYFSRSIEEFWRRWHITLGSWMKDYVFYPLSLSKAFASLGRTSRKLFGPKTGKKIPAFLSMFIVYFLVGYWHGPEWKYVAYGLWNGIFIMSGILLEDAYRKAREKLKIHAEGTGWRLFQIFRTFLLCSFGRFFSRANGLKAALKMIQATFRGLFDFSVLKGGNFVKLGLSKANWILLAVALIVLFYTDYLHDKDVSVREVLSRKHIALCWAVYLFALFAVLVFGVYGPSYDAASFIYEQF